MFEMVATIFRPTSPTNQNRPKVKIFNFRVFHPIWMKFGMEANYGAKSRNRMSVAFWLGADGVRGRWGQGQMGSGADGVRGRWG